MQNLETGQKPETAGDRTLKRVLNLFAILMVIAIVAVISLAVVAMGAIVVTIAK